MKILMIGGNGTIGKRVSAHFTKKHEVITAGGNSGDSTVDRGDSKSIKAMFEKLGKVNADHPMVMTTSATMVNGEIIRMYDNY